MATLDSSLRRQNLAKNDGTETIEQQLTRLDEDIRRLKIEFGIYFSGGLKRAPHEARGRIEAVIKRIADDRNLSYAQRYQFNTIVNRYTAYRELWRRTLKAKGEDLI
jgi:hypothetical protein